MNSNKEKILHSFIMGELKNLGSLETLKKMWIDHPDRWADITEVTLTFLEFCEPVTEFPNEYGLTPEEAKMLSILYEMVDEYNEYEEYSIGKLKTGSEILSDPRWLKIVEYAKKVYDALSKKSVNKE